MKMTKAHDAAGNRVYTIVITDEDFRTPTLDADDRETIALCAKDPLESSQLWGLALLRRRIEQAEERATARQRTVDKRQSSPERSPTAPARSA